MTAYMRVENLSFTYGKETKQPCKALDNIAMEINRGEFVGLIGASGSGKSTLLRQLNGLLKPDEGRILLDGKPIRFGNKIAGNLRKSVGLVFQYPEHQLFKNTVLQDVMFGPLNMGCSKEEAQTRAEKALEQVEVPEEVYHQSPFDLSGGQMRRVALAGILSMQPKLLILDEPTAGLDPYSKASLFAMLKKMQEKGVGILLVSHCMDDIAAYCERVYVMEQGCIVLRGPVKDVLKQSDSLKKIYMKSPQVTEIMNCAKDIFSEIEVTCDYEEAKTNILAQFQNVKGWA